MKIGKLYKNNEYFWLLYPSKDIAARARPRPTMDAAYADFLSNVFKCKPSSEGQNVPSVSPKSIFCLLEQDGEYIKVLTTNGEVGWIVLVDWYKDDIEEVNQ
jgi:hypothetical protein